MDIDHSDLVTRYIAMWNEPDDSKRRQTIEDLWVGEGLHVTPLQCYRGHNAIEGRVKSAYAKWVVEEGCVFEPAGLVDTHHDGLRFHWRMRRGGVTASVGFDFVFLSEIGRILHDHQFVEPPAVAGLIDALQPHKL